MDSKLSDTDRFDKVALLYSVVRALFDLDKSLRHLSFAILALHEDATKRPVKNILLQTITLCPEDFENLLPSSVSVTGLMRRLQVLDPQVHYPPESSKVKTLRANSPLFEIVSSMELSERSPQIDWWIRTGQWSHWNLSAFDRLLLCRLSRAVLNETNATFHEALALLTISLAERVLDYEKNQNLDGYERRVTPEILVTDIRDDLVSLQKSLNFAPRSTDMHRLAGVAIQDFVDMQLLQYSDHSHLKVQLLYDNLSKSGL